jgi:holo-[acyl-carrier protein] synthase
VSSDEPPSTAAPPPSTAASSAGLTELGIDIIRVERISQALEKHGRRFPLRILTSAEDAYVRDRPENLAGRWAAKEAVSKVLGLGVRGVGWREIEIARLPTGQPVVRLHDRALRRANQLGMERISVSISHEHEYAVAIAVGYRRTGGTFVFPVDVEARLDDRERQLLARLSRLRDLESELGAAERAHRAPADGGAADARSDYEAPDDRTAAGSATGERAAEGR